MFKVTTYLLWLNTAGPNCTNAVYKTICLKLKQPPVYSVWNTDPMGNYYRQVPL